MGKLVKVFHVVVSSTFQTSMSGIHPGYSTADRIVRSFKTLEDCDEFMNGSSCYKVVEGYEYDRH